MSELEMKIEALIRCVGTNAYENAMSEVKGMGTIASPMSPPADNEVERAIQELLVQLGTPAHIKGYRYIITGLRLVVNKPEIIDAITKELYPQIAEVHSTTASRVERAIRHAVEVTWDRCDLDVIQHYFGNTISLTKGKPTNSEFLAMVSNIVRRNLNF